MSPARERGYATLAALAATAIFGVLALEVTASSRSAVVSAQAERSRARLTAAADAAVAIAVHDLMLSDAARRWTLTDPPHLLTFDGVALTVAVEDENGKAPLNFLTRAEVRRLFELGGAAPADIDVLTEGVIAMRATDGPASGGPLANLGPLTTVDELALLPRMTPALFARIAPAVAVNAPTPAFDSRTASALALAVMSGEGGAAAPATGPLNLTGREVTLRVEARDGAGGALRRATIVEFTGAAGRPFVIRAVD